MKKSYFFSVIVMLCTLSCQDVKSKKLILGKWTCTDWAVKGKSQLVSGANIRFHFDEAGQYTYQNQNLLEKGTFKVQGGKLYTTPENELEMAVDIEKLTADTLIFNMSRGGSPETMLLIREK